MKLFIFPDNLIANNKPESRRKVRLVSKGTSMTSMKLTLISQLQKSSKTAK